MLFRSMSQEGLFSTLKTHVPGIQTACLLPRLPLGMDLASLDLLIKFNQGMIDHIVMPENRSVATVTEEVVRFFGGLEPPFMAFLSLPNALAVGTRFREGAEVYSDTIIKTEFYCPCCGKKNVYESETYIEMHCLDCNKKFTFHLSSATNETIKILK